MPKGPVSQLTPFLHRPPSLRSPPYLHEPPPSVPSTTLVPSPLLFLHGGDSLAAFSQDQLNALALVSLKLNTQANDIFLAFFGVWLVLVGYLIFRSTFLPRLIGVGLMLEGLGWAAFVSPPLGAALFTVTALFGVIGELPLGLWLLIRGVDPDRWRAQARCQETCV